MNKLLGLFLLALAFLAPGSAQAAARFAVCSTTCTWDNTSTAMWSTSTGGATGASAPVAGDDVTLDAATCVGGTTCTITTFAGTISVASITWGACTASTTGCIINVSANNTNFTISSISVNAFNGSGTGTRKWTAGSGTYTLAIGNTNSCFTHATITGDLGSTYNNATWICTQTASNVGNSWVGAGFSFGPTTFNGNTSGGEGLVSGANTFSTLTINGPLIFGFSSIQTVTGAFTIAGTSTNPVFFNGFNLDSTGTISLGAASTATWVGLRNITTTGAAGLTAINCLDFKRNTLANGGSCTAPSGGGGGGRIIGG